MQLHIVAGMELAIDSFSVNFYREMDMELALQEWNTVQATLRTLSTKLSTSMLLLGSSCAASLLLLVQLTVLPDGSQIKARRVFKRRRLASRHVALAGRPALLLLHELALPPRAALLVCAHARRECDGEGEPRGAPGELLDL